jgi:hypothetical protein
MSMEAEQLEMELVMFADKPKPPLRSQQKADSSVPSTATPPPDQKAKHMD